MQKQMTLKMSNGENMVFDIIPNDNTGRSFVLQNSAWRLCYSYNTLVYAENLTDKNFYANGYTDYSATTRKHIYNMYSPFVFGLYEQGAKKTKTGNFKETFIKFISRCGDNMPPFAPEKINFKNIEFEYTRFGGEYVKRITKNIV